ncbi:Imm47 family immunity protein [Acinetobacter venetianus]|uniref:Imm47 family immunity protein n=1 Tax=Acinetobacter venetianus TaxID=52133 RepID=UPI00384A8AE9
MKVNTDTFDILKPDIWFGSKPNVDQFIEFESPRNEKEVLSALCFSLKRGDFHKKNELESLILNSKDILLKRQAIRLYCYVATHDDVGFLRKFLAYAEHDEVFTFITYAPHTLSYNVIPLLFSLLEEYQDTVLEEDILSSINTIFPFGYEGEKFNIDELKTIFSSFYYKIDKDGYYYDGELVFIGDLTKKLFPAIVETLQNNQEFLFIEAPTLLSIWSGSKFPVVYGQFLSEREYNLTINYIKEIAKSKWEKGSKYFYGHKVA